MPTDLLMRQTSLVAAALGAAVTYGGAHGSVGGIIVGSLQSCAITLLLQFVLLRGIRAVEERVHSMSQDVRDDRSASPLLALSVPGAVASGALYFACCGGRWLWLNNWADQQFEGESALPTVPHVVVEGDDVGTASASLVGALQDAEAAEEPRVLSLDAAASNLLMPPWTAATLISQVESLSGVYVSARSRSFGPYHDERRPLARALGLSPLHSYSEASRMRTSDFFARPEQRRPAWRHAYYSGEVERDLPPSMLAALRPLEAALVRRGPQTSSVNLWLGGGGVSAPCHFDGYHNAIAQLSGRKRFVLAPPSAWSLLRPFPFLHPSHAQCQANMSSLSARVLAEAGARSVELARGEVLYLPPAWFHETMAIGDEGGSGGDGTSSSSAADGGGGGGAVGINGWTGWEEAKAAESLFRLPRPVPREPQASDTAAADGTRKAMGAAAALVAILSATALDDRAQLATRIWQERYADVVRSGALVSQEQPLQQSGRRVAGEMALLDCAALQEEAYTDWAARVEARQWAEAVSALARSKLSNATRGGWLANLAEVVAAEHVGVAAVGEFWRRLEECSA